MSSPRVILPSNINYTCTCCGACCQKWQITISEDEAERFKKDDWPALLAEMKTPGAPFAKDGIMDPKEEAPPATKNGYIKFDSTLKYVFKMDDSQKCIFLNDKKLCSMHAAKGFDYKSHTCKGFPIKTLRYPGGEVLASLSFFCIGVTDERNEKITEEQVLKLLEDENDFITLTDRLLLCEGLEIGFDDMLKINHFISDFLFSKENGAHHFDLGYMRCDNIWEGCGAALTFEERLTAALFFILGVRKMARSMKEKAKESWQSEFTKEISSVETLEGLMKICVERIADTPVKNFAMLIPMVFISLQQVTKKELSNFSKASHILFNMIKCATGMGSFDFNDFAFNVGFSDHAKVRFALDDTDQGGLVERYLSHIIYRKKIFFTSNMVKGYQYIALFYSLVKWYAKSFAVERHADSTSYADVSKAVRFVEKCFANHSILLNVLETNSNFAGFMEPLFENPSMVKSVIMSRN